MVDGAHWEDSDLVLIKKGGDLHARAFFLVEAGCDVAMVRNSAARGGFERCSCCRA